MFLKLCFFKLLCLVYYNFSSYHACSSSLHCNEQTDICKFPHLFLVYHIAIVRDYICLLFTTPQFNQHNTLLHGRRNAVLNGIRKIRAITLDGVELTIARSRTGSYIVKGLMPQSKCQLQQDKREP